MEGFCWFSWALSLCYQFFLHVWVCVPILVLSINCEICFITLHLQLALEALYLGLLFLGKNAKCYSKFPSSMRTSHLLEPGIVSSWGLLEITGKKGKKEARNGRISAGRQAFCSASAIVKLQTPWQIWQARNYMQEIATSVRFTTWMVSRYRIFHGFKSNPTYPFWYNLQNCSSYCFLPYT